MVPRPSQQVEKLVDEALKHNRLQALEDFLLDETIEGTKSKCSKQFLSKLDKLMKRELDQRNAEHAGLGLNILHKFGGNLVFPNGQGLSVMVSDGLVKKWFERARELWLEGGPQRKETLLNLAEDFFDALMVVHESGKEGTYHVTESLLYHIGKLASNSQVNIMIQKEAARKLNAILGKIPVELKREKKILSSQEASGVMDHLAGRILKGGDYDLQVALMEALCRMATQTQRKELANRWFTLQFVADTFCKIQDSQFETDCRKFLNLLNGMQGDGRSVFSYPCLEAFLDKRELLMPVDDKLEEFWVDFNLGSQSISFYFSLADEETQDGQWDTLYIPENEVSSYTVEEEKGVKVLQMVLSEPVSVNGVEGSKLCLHFSPSLDILQAARKVFGQAKHKRFVGKTSMSTVKTTVQIVLEDGGSQVGFPESHVSPTQPENRCTASAESVGPGRQPALPQSGLGGAAVEEADGSSHQPITPPSLDAMMTPVRRKVSTAIASVCSSTGRLSKGSPFSCVLPAATPVSKAKVKPALSMISSAERRRECELRDVMMVKSPHSVPALKLGQAAAQTQSTEVKQDRRRRDTDEFRRNIPVAKALEMVQADQDPPEDPLDSSGHVVPESQPPFRTDGSVFPGLCGSDPRRRKMSVSSSLLPRQMVPAHGVPRLDSRVESPRPRGQGGLSQTQLHSQLTQRLQEVVRQREQEAAAPRGVPEETQKPQPGRRGGGGKRKSQAGERKGPVEGGANPAPAKQPSGRTKADNLTDSMVRLISSHYRSTTSKPAPKPPLLLTTETSARPLFDKSWTRTIYAGKEHGLANGSGLSKSFSHARRTSEMHEDVYDFNVDSTKTPEMKGRTSAEMSVLESSALNVSLTHSSSAKKDPPAKPGARPARKHPFSDTDTDHATEVSWLGGSGRKPKPKVADYSRQPVRPSGARANGARKSPDLSLPSPKPVKEQPKPNRKRQKKTVEKEDIKSSTAAIRRTSERPQRAAALTKTYRELSESDSQSESGRAPPPKKAFDKCIGRVEKDDKPTHKTAEHTEREGKRKTGKVLSSKRDQKKMPEQTKKEDVRPDPFKMKTVAPRGTTEQPKETWASRFSSFCPSPPPAERMRSAEKSVPSLPSPASPLPSLSISPIYAGGVGSDPSPGVKLAGPLQGVQASSFMEGPGSRRSGRTSCQPLVTSAVPAVPTSCAAAQMPNPSAERQAGPIPSPLSPSVPLITSTAVGEGSADPSPHSSSDLGHLLRDFMGAHRALNRSFDQDSVVSIVKLSQSSHKSVNSVTLLHAELERTPSPRQRSNLGTPEFQSGPVSSRKRLSVRRTVSSSEEEEEEEQVKQERAGPSDLAVRMRPRKLFKTSESTQALKKNLKPRRPELAHGAQHSSSDEEDEEVEISHGGRGRTIGRKQSKRPQCRNTRDTVEDVEVRSVVSSHLLSNRWQGSVEADPGMTPPDVSSTQEMRYVCHQFSSELQRKFQNRSRRVEQYTKQSLNTVQQHIASVKVQVHQFRSQRLENVKRVLMEEIKNLEQDDSALKSMEEDLMVYWNKQATAFQTYQDRGTRRLQHLKSTIQSSVCQGLECEERIFSSEMCLMKKDMKSVQDQLYKEMQEEELLSVRRGLLSLFLPEASRAIR